MTKSELIAKALKAKYPPHQVQYICEVVKARAEGVDPEYKRARIDIRTFLTQTKYMNVSAFMWPKLLDNIVDLNNETFEEAILTGAIGSGKTTIALYSLSYQLYLISCLTNPHKTYNQDPNAEIVIIFQNRTAEAAKKTGYGRFREMIQRSEYFQKHFMFDTNLKSEMRFPNNIVVRPLSGEETAALGENVICGLIDEMNYMESVDGSKKAIDTAHYDQAWALYNTISKRRKSRFLVKGVLPGILFLVSSKRYPDQFTDRKVAESVKELKETGKTTTYVFDKCIWDVRPTDTFTGEWFTIFVGDSARSPYILQDTDIQIKEDEHLYKKIPLEFKIDFERDIMAALRDIAAISTLSLHPFIRNREAVKKCFGKHLSIFSRQSTDFVSTSILLYPKRFYKPEIQRYAHIDLASTKDSAGLAIGCIPEFMKIKTGYEHFEMLPKIHIDGLLEIPPPKGGEIIFAKIRKVLYMLRSLGLNIVWVSLDSYQDKDTRQLLRQEGFATGPLSMDKSTLPYDTLKTAFYDGRVFIPEHVKAQKEIIELERDVKKNKIDHPPTGCFVGNTKIVLANRSIITFEKLVTRYKTDKNIYIISYDESRGTFVRSHAIDIKITKYANYLTYVITNRGLHISTKEHKYLCWGRGWVEAKDLKQGDRIISLHNLWVVVKNVWATRLKKAVPVYDMFVPEHNNFCLASGEVVHNSKDCADSLCGVVYGLTMRREIWAKHGINPQQAAPSIMTGLDKLDNMTSL